MRALLDVSMLLALFDPHHIHHKRAGEWWESFEGGWASCPLTQNGFVRVSSKPGYTHPIGIADAWRALRKQIELSDHEFWPDSISITDPDIFDHSRLLGPNQITDVYLLALAVKHGGRLVTFDRGIPLAAARGAEARHLAVV
jgi:toxin-antitoxin system PIN domain toxin